MMGPCAKEEELQAARRKRVHDRHAQVLAFATGHETELAWRMAGEQAIRGEMERRLAAWLAGKEAKRGAA